MSVFEPEAGNSVWRKGRWSVLVHQSAAISADRIHPPPDSIFIRCDELAVGKLIVKSKAVDFGNAQPMIGKQLCPYKIGIGTSQFCNFFEMFGRIVFAGDNGTANQDVETVIV